MTLKYVMWSLFALAIAFVALGFYVHPLYFSAALGAACFGFFLGICRIGIALGDGEIMIE